MPTCGHPDAIELRDIRGALVRTHCDECNAAAAPEPIEPVGPQLFRQRPIDVEAIQFDGTNAAAIAAWASGGLTRIRCWPVGPQLWVDTVGDVQRVDVGGWLIREDEHIRTSTADHFAITHTPIE